MSRKKPIGAFNKDYLAKTSEKDFLDSHKHLLPLGFTVEILKKEWKSAQPKEKKEDK